MEIVESKARSKTLFAVCHLISNNQSSKASDIAKIAGQDPSNVSRYCNEWCDAGIMHKNREGKYVSFDVNKYGLAKLLFEHIASDLEDKLGYDTVENLKNTDEDEIMEIAAGFTDQSATQAPADSITDKIDMVHYFLSRQIERDSVLAEELGHTLQLLLTQPAVSTVETAQSVIDVVKQQIGGQKVEVIDKLMSLIKVNEEPVRDAKTVSEAFDESIDVMLFMAGKDGYEVSEEEEKFLSHLRMYRTGFQLQLA